MLAQRDKEAGRQWSPDMLEFITWGAGQINTLDALAAAASGKRAVRCPAARWCNGRPAAFMMHQPGETLLRLFRAGLYLYEKDGPT